MFLGFAMDRRMHYAAINQAVQQSTAAHAAAALADRSARRSVLHRNRRSAGRLARARDAPDLGAIDLMTTPLEIREVSYVRE